MRAEAMVVALLSLPGCKLGKKTVPPGEGIDVAVMPATYVEGSHATGEVKQKCGFERKVAEAVVDEAPGSTLTTHDVSGKVLTMEVVAMQGIDPAWQGDRTVILRGTYSDGGVTTGTFRIRRSAPGGLFGGMMGVCRGLDEIAGIMGEDIADWLRDPEMGSELEE